MHKHLTWQDRLKIERGIREKLTVAQIADRLHVALSTIYREIKRGQYTHLNSDLTTETRYSPDIAQEKYNMMLTAKGAALKIGSDLKLAQYIEERIVKDHFSPAAVIGEIKQKNLKFSVTICEKTIYNYIKKGVFLNLEEAHLPMKGKRKRSYQKIKIKAARASMGESIERRPPEIGDRKTFGHWEMDCVLGPQKTKESLLVFTERLTREELIFKIPNKKTDSVIDVLNSLEITYQNKFPKIFKSITVDNGTEFSNVAGMEASIYGDGLKRTKIYTCHPYSAYERGSNENQNRMIRRFFPKGTSFKNIPQEYISRVQKWINKYPRELFNFQSSDDLFERYVSIA